MTTSDCRLLAYSGYKLEQMQTQQSSPSNLQEEEGMSQVRQLQLSVTPTWLVYLQFYVIYFVCLSPLPLILPNQQCILDQLPRQNHPCVWQPNCFVVSRHGRSWTRTNSKAPGSCQQVCEAPSSHTRHTESMHSNQKNNCQFHTVKHDDA